MRLLVDQGFPVSVQQYRTPNLELWRWNFEGSASDLEFVRFAAHDGFQGVVFLGIVALMSAEVRETASDEGLSLLATKTVDPMQALIAIGTNVAAVERLAVAGSCLVVHSREVARYDDPPVLT